MKIKFVLFLGFFGALTFVACKKTARKKPVTISQNCTYEMVCDDASSSAYYHLTGTVNQQFGRYKIVNLDKINTILEVGAKYLIGFKIVDCPPITMGCGDGTGAGIIKCGSYTTVNCIEVTCIKKISSNNCFETRTYFGEKNLIDIKTENIAVVNNDKIEMEITYKDDINAGNSNNFILEYCQECPTLTMNPMPTIPCRVNYKTTPTNISNTAYTKKVCFDLTTIKENLKKNYNGLQTVYLQIGNSGTPVLLKVSL